MTRSIVKMSWAIISLDRRGSNATFKRHSVEIASATLWSSEGGTASATALTKLTSRCTTPCSITKFRICLLRSALTTAESHLSHWFEMKRITFTRIHVNEYRANMILIMKLRALTTHSQMSRLQVLRVQQQLHEGHCAGFDYCSVRMFALSLWTSWVSTRLHTAAGDLVYR